MYKLSCTPQLKQDKRYSECIEKGLSEHEMATMIKTGWTLAEIHRGEWNNGVYQPKEIFILVRN